MATYAELGVTATGTVQDAAGSLHVPGIDSTVEMVGTTALTLTLPRPAAVRATFWKEGVGEKILKLFEEEVQTGDAEFDDEVFVSTDTPQATAVLLASEEVRNTILDYVTLAGPIQIDGTTVKVVMPGTGDSDDQNVCRLLAALLA